MHEKWFVDEKQSNIYHHEITDIPCTHICTNYIHSNLSISGSLLRYIERIYQDIAGD